MVQMIPFASDLYTHTHIWWNIHQEDEDLIQANFSSVDIAEQRISDYLRMRGSGILCH